ncbi:response regulator [Marinobacter sp. HL-58]|uniref:response regulator n=1 Tax=Marinobacter sp. HL-58 TaxID=1479237 RepID=UPI0004871D24|nr:response regulator [Marinobacter sp. HL-58]KPP97358.1 MAG: Response regulators consisting of a CheY-like receiver domain and a winged-helix DNA-binding domain [Marinobacter sp. HL-58]
MGEKSEELQRILYVEDDADIRAVAELALETVGGFSLKTCSSGQEALDEGPDFGPDLVLLDVMMPGMDGPSTLRAMQANPVLKSVPVVFMTAKVQTEEVAFYRELGAVEVIPKPFDPMTLADRIREIWKSKV